MVEMPSPSSITAAISPDGRHAVIGSSHEQGVIVRDLDEGTNLYSIPNIVRGRREREIGVAFVPPGRRFITVAYDVRVWDLGTGTLVSELGANGFEVSVFAVSRDGHMLATGHTLPGIWNLSTGQVCRLRGYGGHIESIAFSLDARRVVTGSSDHIVRVNDTLTGERIHRLRGHEGEVVSVAVTPDGSKAVSCGLDWTVRVWDMETGDELRIFKQHQSWVHQIALLPDGHRLVSVSEDASMSVCDLEDDEVLSAFYSDTAIVTCDVSSDGRRIIVGDKSGRVHVLAFEDPSIGVEGGELARFELPSPVTALSWHPSRSMLAVGTAGGDHSVLEWHPESSYLEQVVHIPAQRLSPVETLRWSTDGKVLLLLHEDGEEMVSNIAGSPELESEWAVPLSTSSDGRWRASMRAKTLLIVTG